MCLLQFKDLVLFRCFCKVYLQVLLLSLLLLSHFSHVQLWATHQALPSLGFSRQEHWSGLPFLSPMHESEKWKWISQSCPTLSDPMDCSLAGSSIRGIFQARVLEWVALPSLCKCFTFIEIHEKKFHKHSTVQISGEYQIILLNWVKN